MTRLPLELLAFALFNGQKVGRESCIFSSGTSMFGVVPLGAGAGKACGEWGLPVRWGTQRDPSQPAGQQVVRILAGLTRDTE